MPRKRYAENNFSRLIHALRDIRRKSGQIVDTVGAQEYNIQVTYARVRVVDTEIVALIPRTKKIQGNRDGNRKRIFVQKLLRLRYEKVDNTRAVRAYRRGRGRLLLDVVQGH